ncbi:NAD-dependent epimerase/dehydratase family protein [Candidatus Thioglobus sp.]|nr:NAD-dependent epimerase/dehydratase family protein [Candidatus Thioglobus sp.]
MRNIFITGSTGFIGKQLVKSIDSNNIRVLSRTNQKGYDTIVCNLEKDSIPVDALNNIETVFHLAGFAHDMRNDIKIKNLCKKVNVDATVELANLAVKSGVKKFIFVSSVKAGGGAAAMECMNEDYQKEPVGVYGKTKREAEIKLLKIGKESGMHVSIIRPSLVYGPNLKGNLKLMLMGIKKGWFPCLPEIGNRRSMIHVDDLVQAILLVAMNEHANGEVFIATDGVPHSSREIYESMCDALGKPTSKIIIPNFIFDIVSFISPSIKYKVEKLLGNEWYSSNKLEKLGFKPQRTLKEINETFI